MAFVKAVREAVSMLISLSSVSGGGKTLSGILLASGIAGPKGRVGFIDAENGRGRLYEDDPLVRAALPQGYEYDQITAPFSPEAYKDKITEAERAGITVCLVDSFSHEWEGIGGCTEIAEQNKLGGMPNWAMAKLKHKRLVYHVLSSPMHLVFCLRAREKVKIVGSQVTPIGIQPITEKNFVFEMLLSLILDEKTHRASPIKVPRMIESIFPENGKLLTKEDGERVRLWNETGAMADPTEQLKKRARAAAEDGTVAYGEFFSALANRQKKVLIDSTHADNKAISERADRDARVAAEEESGQPFTPPPGWDPLATRVTELCGHLGKPHAVREYLSLAQQADGPEAQIAALRASLVVLENEADAAAEKQEAGGFALSGDAKGRK